MVVVHPNAGLQLTKDAIPPQTAQTVVDLVVVRAQSGKKTTLKFTRRRTVYRRNGIIVRKMTRNPKVNQTGIDESVEGLGLGAEDVIDLHREGAHHEIVHQDSKEIGKFLNLIFFRPIF